jgi:hypothetical protein
MFLHLIGNDPKFPKAIRDRFEAAMPNRHVFVIVKTHAQQPENGGEGFIYVSTPEQLKNVVTFRLDWEAIIINGMLSRLASFWQVLPQQLPVAYYLWGVEAYNAVLNKPDALYEPETAKHVLSLKARLRFYASYYFGALRRLRKECRFIAQKLDVALFSLEAEIQHFVEHGLLPEHIQYVNGRVGHGLDFSAEIFALEQVGDSILVGNSGDPSNNHLDAFLWLSRQRFSTGRRVVVPLSYGGNEEYRKVVLNKGRQLFGELFYPVLDFMPLEDYNELIKSCGIVIMNHLRQQGFGNIVTALAMGATVYLQPRTTVSAGLKNLGFTIREIGASRSQSELQESPFINEAERARNVHLCHKHFSKEASLEKTRCLIEALRNRIVC